MKIKKIKAVIKEKKPLFINSDFITLDSALKFAGIVGTGGEAKMLINEGLIFVNKEVCTMRGKKLRDGDVFSFEREIFEVKNK
ncbi:MAG: RNA-binding S4 domain-containing protein [Ruminococcaceae bacterium]|nr:RNA-binding S4 domain-containing protein [Oscillospiraceae bacterium]